MKIGTDVFGRGRNFVKRVNLQLQRREELREQVKQELMRVSREPPNELSRKLGVSLDGAVSLKSFLGESIRRGWLG